MKKKPEKKEWFPLFGAAFVFILCACILYLGENVGLSDNGDFRRVLLVNNLRYEDETDHYYLFKQNYIMTVEGESVSQQLHSLVQTTDKENIYSSPHFVLIKLSKVLNYFANLMTGKPVEHYNIAWLAFLYIVMLTLAAWAIFDFFKDSPLRMKIGIFLVFVFLFCDSGYILYFNSFYGEPLQYVSLLMLICVGLLIYQRPSVPKVVSFYVCLYFFAGSKLANIPYSILISLVGLIFVILRKDKLFKLGVVCSALVSVVLMVHMYSTIPDWMENDTTYQSVFFGILKDSKDPEKDLKRLGVDPQYAQLANTHAYLEPEQYPIDTSTEQFHADFYDKVGKGKIVGFYLLHPVRLFQKLSVAIENSAYIRPPNLGNSSTQIMELTQRFSGWSHFRVFARFPYHPAVVLILLFVITAYVIFADIFLYKRRQLEDPKRLYMVCGINVLMLGLWINLMLPIFGNGEADIAKHMFLFINFMDLLIAFFVIDAFRVKKRGVLMALLGIFIVVASLYVRLPAQTVEFGAYEGRPIEWEVIGRNQAGDTLLVSKKEITQMPFDDEDNLWEDSQLREWLNEEFLEEFTQEEQEAIVPVVNDILLAYNDKNKAVSGDHPLYWNFTKRGAADMAETAYHYELTDKVYIPTLQMLEHIRTGGSYWVLCPYTNNDKMERYMNQDGFVLHTDVKNERGVRPVITVKSSR